MATNNPGLLTNNSQLMRDQAVSEPDRRLLGQIQTAVFGSSGAAAPLGGTAVHFILRDGAVRIVGFVPNVEEQKRIEGIVQQVPGVIRVYDALQIGVSATPSVQGQ
jgi:osmotically-inducible protein OsmY